MKNFIFYAVENDEGIVSIKNEKYESIKAIFSKEKDAQKVLDTNKDKGLKIVKVNIVSKK